MSDKRRVLWIDNDVRYVFPFELALQQNGYDVIVVPTVTEGEQKLAAEHVDLVILDVMIPVTEEEEQHDYPPAKTDDTHKTGLVFYRRIRDVLSRRNIGVLVMTVRIDQAIADEFANAGLPREFFVRKFDVRTADAFAEKVRSAMKDAPTRE